MADMYRVKHFMWNGTQKQTLPASKTVSRHSRRDASVLQGVQQTGAAVGGMGTSATLDVNVLIVLTYHKGIPTIQVRTQNLGI